MRVQGENPGIHSATMSSKSSGDEDGRGSESDIGGHLEGDIVIPGLNNVNNAKETNSDFNTLDEPVLDTITRDLKAIGNKLYYALMPKSTSEKNILMKEWDLWGPLILCTYIGLMLQVIAGDSAGYEFTEVFALVWIGTAGITYNLVFCVSSPISMFQCVCVLGYCLAPIGILVTLFELMKVLGLIQGSLFLRLILAGLAAAWATISAMKIFSNPAAQGEKKYMVIGPVAVFYLLIALLILYHSN